MSQIAPLIKEIVFGKIRMRCAVCSKVAYATESLAEVAADKVSANQKMESYFDSRCGWWHLSRVRQKEKEKE